MWDILKKGYKEVDKGLANIISGNTWGDKRPFLPPSIETPLPVSQFRFNRGLDPRYDEQKKELPIPLPIEVKTRKPVKPLEVKFKTPKIATKITPTIPSKQKQAEARVPTPTPDPRKSWRNFADMVIREGKKRGYHGETLARQKALESGFGKSKFAKERFNYGGVGAYDADPNNAWRFESPEDYLMGPKGYFNLIEKDPRYTKAYKNRANSRAYLEALKEAGYASDPNYVDLVLNTKVYDPYE